MNNLIQLLNKKYQTPQRQRNSFQNSYNSSRGFSSNQSRKNKIFASTGFKSTGRTKYNDLIQSKKQKQQEQHIQIKQVISDDYCGCQNTVNICARISENYFKNISLRQLKQQYEKNLKTVSVIPKHLKKSVFVLLPSQYPEIYFTHLNNLLDSFQNSQISNQHFMCLAWIQFHCKLQYVTFFFYHDLRKIFNNQKNFFDSLDLSLFKQNSSLKGQIDTYERINLRIKQFIISFYQSSGAILIPLSQYAKFLEIVRIQGIKAFTQLLNLFISKKRSEFYEILKFWTFDQVSNLRIFCRGLNWDLFFQQTQLML